MQQRDLSIEEKDIFHFRNEITIEPVVRKKDGKLFKCGDSVRNAEISGACTWKIKAFEIDDENCLWVVPDSPTEAFGTHIGIEDILN